jgi:hypothetical protein
LGVWGVVQDELAVPHPGRTNCRTCGGLLLVREVVDPMLEKLMRRPLTIEVRPDVE